VRKTETINNNLNPDWGFLYMSLQELCDSDPDMKLQVQLLYSGTVVLSSSTCPSRSCVTLILT
jgi:hypothetical protein